MIHYDRIGLLCCKITGALGIPVEPFIAVLVIEAMKPVAPQNRLPVQGTVHPHNAYADFGFEHQIELTDKLKTVKINADRIWNYTPTTLELPMYA